MLNEVTLQGRFVYELEPKTLRSGSVVVPFTLAVERERKEKDGTKKADFIPCEAWGKTAEFITEYFAKGDMILVSGRLAQDKYTDSEGNTKTKFKVVVNHCSFPGGKKAGEPKPRYADNDDDFLPLPDDEDIPF